MWEYNVYIRLGDSVPTCFCYRWKDGGFCQMVEIVWNEGIPSFTNGRFCVNYKEKSKRGCFEHNGALIRSTGLSRTKKILPDHQKHPVLGEGDKIYNWNYFVFELDHTMTPEDLVSILVAAQL